MIKSILEIEQDIYDKIKDELSEIIDGQVYKSGCRPIDAVTEDAVISISDASADQIQEGNVQINIYVPNIGDQPDKERLTEMSKKHDEICKIMNAKSVNEYDFKPGKASDSYEEVEINQYFVNLSFRFKRITF